MRETVKIVNGHDITRLQGMKGNYRVAIWERVDKKGNTWGQYKYFNTQKAAAAFCETF